MADEEPIDEETLPAKKRRERFVGGESAPTMYANHVNVTVSPFDMRLQFSQMQEVTEDEIVFRVVGTLFLSPGQARALRKLLVNKSGTHDALFQSIEPKTVVVVKEDDKKDRPS